MKYLINKLWHFLGSIYLAIILIGLTIVMVVTGTCIEATTNSHACAANFTYSSHFFAFLLGGYFLNILISALRRWPFEKRHVPFLLTHLGLLLLLSGAITKLYFGTQGFLSISEGSGKSEIVIPSTYSLLVESPQLTEQIILNEGKRDLYHNHSHTLSFKILNWLPHSEENWHSWIKEGKLSLLDNSSFVLIDDPLNAFQNFTTLKIYNPQTNNIIKTVPLKLFLESNVKINEYRLTGEIIGNQLIITQVNENTFMKEELNIPLSDNTISLRQPRNQVFIPRRFFFEFETEPKIVFHDTFQKIPKVTLLHPEGKLIPFSLEGNESLFKYNEGYQGYSIGVDIPIFNSKTIVDRKKDRWQDVRNSLVKFLNQNNYLAYPLNHLKDVCEKENSCFITFLIGFLDEWESHGTWLNNASSSFENILNKMDWSSFDNQDLFRWKQKAALFESLQKIASQGVDVLTQLQKVFKKEENLPNLLPLLENQIELMEFFQLTSPPNSLLFSSALREIGITPDLFLEDDDLTSSKKFHLESQLAHSIENQEAPIKWEDRRPGILLEIDDGMTKEMHSLHYEKFATGLKFPILKGKYLIRFQSITEKIPYHLRLVEARQINYPGTKQPLSYEADLIISQKDEQDEALLSMNKVYETWNGYRFYLANILPGSRNALQYVQIVINRDPTKYFLTIPGFIVLLIGILLILFNPFLTFFIRNKI